MRQRNFLSAIIDLVMGLAEIILVLRIIFRLFAANPNASFVHWIYGTSGTLLEPFRGIFPTTTIGRNYVLDFTALIALVVYALFRSLLVYVGRLLEGTVTHTSTHRSGRE